MSEKSEVCLFPTCKAHPDTNGYCVFHRIYSNSVEVKENKPIPKETKSMKGVKAQLKKLYPLYLAKKGNRCEINSEVCTRKATVINHTRGRGKNEILNESTWQASCAECNLWIEQHHAEGVALGAKKSRHKKE